MTFARNLEDFLEEGHVGNECMIDETSFGVCFPGLCLVMEQTSSQDGHVPTK